MVLGGWVAGWGLGQGLRDGSWKSRSGKHSLGAGSSCSSPGTLLLHSGTIPVDVDRTGWSHGWGEQDWESQPGFQAKSATGSLQDLEQSVLSTSLKQKFRRWGRKEAEVNDTPLAALQVLNCHGSSSSYCSWPSPSFSSSVLGGVEAGGLAG